MDFSIQYLSFFVIQPEGGGSAGTKAYKHYQTLDGEAYAYSEIKHFLDGEFARIAKRKVEKNPSSEHAPTKIGRFIVEPGHEPGSNPNYNLFQRLRTAVTRDEFLWGCDEMVRIYMDTSAVRGGAMIFATAKLNQYFDEPFVFVMKCDFEPKVARIADEKSLIAQVDMAISARNIKSIQYPFMPEEGILEELELKVHQASHARYFEDFLKYVSYEKSMPEIVSEQVLTMVSQYMEHKWQGAGPADEDVQHDAGYEAQPLQPSDGGYGEHSPERETVLHAEPFREAAATGGSMHAVEEAGDEAQDRLHMQQPPWDGQADDRPSSASSGGYAASTSAPSPSSRLQQERQSFEVWAARDKRDLQETWGHEQVLEAAALLTEQKDDLELKFKLGGISVKALLADYGCRLHIARHNGKYVVLIEGDQFEFDKGMSPIELLSPEPIEQVIRRIGESDGNAGADAPQFTQSQYEGDKPPW